MRISDWSSDVCSSDLRFHRHLKTFIDAGENILLRGEVAMRGLVQHGVGDGEGRAARLVMRAAAGNAIAFAVPRLNGDGVNLRAFLAELALGLGAAFLDPCFRSADSFCGGDHYVDDAGLKGVCGSRVLLCRLGGRTGNGEGR